LISQPVVPMIDLNVKLIHYQTWNYWFIYHPFVLSKFHHQSWRLAVSCLPKPLMHMVRLLTIN